MKAKILLLIVLLLCSLFYCQNSQKEKQENTMNNPVNLNEEISSDKDIFEVHKLVIGKWQGDAEAMGKDPDFQMFLESLAPDEGSLVIDMIVGYVFEITKDMITLKMEFMDQLETELFNYKVVSILDNSMVVENVGTYREGEQVEIIIIDDSHIKIIVNQEDTPPFVLKRME